MKLNAFGPPTNCILRDIPIEYIEPSHMHSSDTTRQMYQTVVDDANRTGIIWAIHV